MSEAVADTTPEGEESATMLEMLDSQPRPELTDIEKLFKHGLTHAIVAMATLAIWAAADTWYIVTGLGLANFLSIVTAILAGATISTLIHEWFHLAGARYAKATYSIPEASGLFIYDWDFGKNNVQQFKVMSYGGQFGSVLAVVLLISLVPMDNSGRAMLIAAAFGSGVFGAAIEWPVLKRTNISLDPLSELKLITPEVFKKALFIGIGSGLLAWFILS